MQAEREQHAAAVQQLRDEFAGERSKLHAHLESLQQSKHHTDAKTSSLHQELMQVRQQLAQEISEKEWMWSDKLKPLQVCSCPERSC